MARYSLTYTNKGTLLVKMYPWGQPQTPLGQAQEPEEYAGVITDPIEKTVFRSIHTSISGRWLNILLLVPIKGLYCLRCHINFIKDF